MCLGGHNRFSRCVNLNATGNWKVNSGKKKKKQGMSVWRFCINEDMTSLGMLSNDTVRDVKPATPMAHLPHFVPAMSTPMIYKVKNAFA